MPRTRVPVAFGVLLFLVAASGLRGQTNRGWLPLISWGCPRGRCVHAETEAPCSA